MSTLTRQLVDEYLAGIQWWENYGYQSHRERMKALASGMRYKTPPESRSTRNETGPAVSESHLALTG